MIMLKFLKKLYQNSFKESNKFYIGRLNCLPLQNLLLQVMKEDKFRVCLLFMFEIHRIVRE